MTILEEPRKVAVVCVCGLPGSGKSTFCHSLRNQLSPRVRVHVLEYDQLQSSLQRTVNDPLEAWRLTRQQARHELLTLLSLADRQQRTIILLDDNFYLRSMRKQIYKTLQSSPHNNCCITFGTVWLDVPLEICLSRNAQRSRRVADAVITRMHSSMELPGREEDYWEACAYQILSGNNSTVEASTTMESWISALPPVRVVLTDNDTAAAAATEEQACSVRHQVDQWLRQCVAAVAFYDRRLIQSANQARKQVLSSSWKDEESNHNSSSSSLRETVLFAFTQTFVPMITENSNLYLEEQQRIWLEQIRSFVRGEES